MYDEICRSGMDVAHQLRDDILKINFKEHFKGDSSSVDPLIIAALKDCYKPRCYSISYDCFKKGFAFDPASALAFLHEQAANFESKGYLAVVDPLTFSITYTRRRVEINRYEGEANPELINKDFDSRHDISAIHSAREINSDGTVPGPEPIALPAVSQDVPEIQTAISPSVSLDNSTNPVNIE